MLDFFGDFQRGFFNRQEVLYYEFIGYFIS